MAIKHAFVSAVADDPDTGQVTPSRWNAPLVVDADGVPLPAAYTTPATPASGNVALFGRMLAGGEMVAFKDSSGITSTLQPHIGRNKVYMWVPLGNTNSGPVTTIGSIPITYTGSVTARPVATSNTLAAMRRVGAVSAATAGSFARFTNGAAQFFRGDITGAGGFRAVFRWGCSDPATVAGARTFVGMSTQSTGAFEPSAGVNFIGVGTDSTDATLCIMSNDGTASGTKVNLGADFPDHTLSADAYELALYCSPGSGQVGWQVTRLNTGHMATGTITTDLPATTTLLYPQFSRANNATALAVALDLCGLYIETDN